MAATTSKTQTDEYEAVRTKLASFATQGYEPDMGIAYHEEPKNKISIPYGMDKAKAAEIAAEAARADREMMVFRRKFRFRPYDGAAALVRVLEKHFGTTGRGKPIQTFFGPIPPQLIDVEVGYGQTIQVPWGHIDFVALEGTLMLGSTNDEEYGELFELMIECPKKYSASVHGFFNVLEVELRDHSIYKGKAIRGTDQPKFLDLQVDPSIVYNQDVYDTLETSVWGVIREVELLRELNVKTDPKILLHGPYGTGKSETGRMTAKIATDHGWTFIAFNSGKQTIGDLEKTLQTARLLSPAVVFVEDIDIYAQETDNNAQTRMMEMFDGLSSKGREVMVLMTSNHVEAFRRGMLRTGRIDHMIEIAALDREATERLIRLVNKDMLGDVDFDQVWEAMHGYEPSFVRSTFDDARQAAAIRNAAALRAAGTYTKEAAKKFLLNTEDFVTAANLKRPQHERHGRASDAKNDRTVDNVMRAMIKDVLEKELLFSNDRIGDIEIVAADQHAATSR